MGSGCPNLYRETTLSGANGDREKKCLSICSADHEQDWRPYLILLKVLIIHILC